MIWRMFLRWLGRWLGENRKNDAVEIDKGIDAVLPETRNPKSQGPTMPQAKVNQGFRKKEESVRPHRFGKQ